MYYKQRRRLYSQNNLFNPKLVAKLIRNSSIGKKDTVLEIGPGKGIMTSALLANAGKVIAVERDQKLYLYLCRRFSGERSLELVNENFLKFRLPDYPYKVFANIPFIITADVIRKLTADKNSLEAYLVVQKEAAKRFIGKPYDSKNSMIATLLKPWFETSVVWRFRREDFVPTPRVDTVMLKIKRREASLITSAQAQAYKDFVVYTYNRSRVAKTDFDQLMKLFDNYLRRAGNWQKRLVSKKARRIIAKSEEIEKIHRTRLDKKWKRFR